MLLAAAMACQSAPLLRISANPWMLEPAGACVSGFVPGRSRGIRSSASRCRGRTRNPVLLIGKRLDLLLRQRERHARAQWASIVGEKLERFFERIHQAVELE